MKQQIGLLSLEERKKITEDIIDYFATERGQEIGVIAAEDVLDAFLEMTGVFLYNKGVSDTKKFLKEKFEQLDVDIEISLKK
jgi:uncharacterized protein (DUF2164 family)